MTLASPRLGPTGHPGVRRCAGHASCSSDRGSPDPLGIMSGSETRGLIRSKARDDENLRCSANALTERAQVTARQRSQPVQGSIVESEIVRCPPRTPQAKLPGRSCRERSMGQPPLSRHEPVPMSPGSFMTDRSSLLSLRRRLLATTPAAIAAVAAAGGLAPARGAGAPRKAATSPSSSTRSAAPGFRTTAPSPASRATSGAT